MGLQKKENRKEAYKMKMIELIEKIAAMQKRKEELIEELKVMKVLTQSFNLIIKLEGNKQHERRNH